jgi:hypothetical protein
MEWAGDLGRVASGEWRELLETKSPREIAELLANPNERSEALSDSHAFASCMLYMAHGR